MAPRWTASSPYWTAVILVVFAATVTARSNTPPIISMPRDWTVQEGEPTGTVVVRVQGHDSDGDTLQYSLGKTAFGEDGSHLFAIDQAGVVRLMKPLQGLGGRSLYLSVAVTDGQFNTLSDARVQVGGPVGSKTTLNGGLMAALNPNPIPFGSVPGGEPPFTNTQSRGPFVSGGLQGAVPSLEAESEGSPPLLTLPTSAIWRVRGSAPLHHRVAVVKAVDVSGDPFFFTLKDREGLVAIDRQTGEVSVKKELRDKVGNHKVLVEVTNRHGTADGEVLLQVLPPAPIMEATTVAAADGPNTDTSVTPSTDSRATLIAIIKNGPTAATTTPSARGDRLPPSEEVQSHTTVVVVLLAAIVLMSGGGGLVGCLYCRRRGGGTKKPLESTDSCVKYNEKGLELTPASSVASSLTRQASALPRLLRFWSSKRARSNEYDGGAAPPELPFRQMSSSSEGLTLGRPDEWELPRHKLKMLYVLGEGCFGQVWKFEATDLRGSGTGKTFVAVKTLKNNAGAQEKSDLQQELKVLKMLGRHPNVVALVGCCTEKEPMLVVLEYMAHGKLQTYLRDRRASQPYSNLHGPSSSLSSRDLTIFALQVAKGMEYLARHGIVHRDLAARNVLVGEDKVCKVADFGFARDLANNYVYMRKSDGQQPIRWMAIESLFDNIFTTKTDVWSFGILLWEIVTLGATPYPGLTHQEVTQSIKAGHRLEKPSYCKREFYTIMFYCWYEDPKMRPTFKEIIERLEGLIKSEVDYIELNQFPSHSYYNIKTDASSGELL